VLKLAERYTIASINYDPWRAAMMIKAFEQRGLSCTVWPWTDARVIPAASELYDAIVSGKLTHPGDEHLDRHMAYMGHEKIETTMRYVHHVPKHDAAAKQSAFIAAQLETVSPLCPEPPTSHETRNNSRQLRAA
jgi:phage terminase large subunit-like protein